jgi:hypothetical protein
MLGASKRACTKSSAGRLRTSRREAFTSRALIREAIDRAKRSVREVLEGLPETIRTEVIEFSGQYFGFWNRADSRLLWSAQGLVS